MNFQNQFLPSHHGFDKLYGPITGLITNPTIVKR